MAIRLFSFLLALAGLTTSFLAFAQPQDGNDTLGDIVAPDLERREIKEGKIDSENWEVGIFAGVMSIEDFGSDTVYGARVAYHITEGLFAEFSFGSTQAGETSFETLSGSTQILTDDERDLTYYNALLGINVFQGEIFFGSERAYNTNLYLLAGAGNTDFADDNYFTTTFGVGTRMFFTDWFSLHGDIRAHSFNHELLGEEKTIVNWEPSLGLTIFF